jgi:hypothetical protein
LRTGAWVGLAFVVLALGGVGAVPSRAGGPEPAVDVELAFDTTGSMARSLATARQNADRILNGVLAIVPNARFGIVSFRDHGNPGGEYQTLQPLTSSSSAVKAALSRLKAVHNTSPGNLPVESYNLVFHRSYADNALRWRPDARKIVIVIGDAEPYGAASGGFAGCSDAHVDPDGLNSKAELAGMRASGRTLVMIREVSHPTASSQCYQSLVAGAFPGGATRDGNAADLVTPLVDLVHGAVAPLELTASLPVVLPGASAIVTATLANPNTFPLQVNSLTIDVPGGFESAIADPAPSTENGGRLIWDAPQTLEPGGSTKVRLTLRAGSRSARATISATGAYQLGAGDAFTTGGQLSLFVTRQIAVAAKATTQRVSIAGGATLIFPTTAQTAATAAGPQRQGRFTVKSRQVHAIVLRPYAFRLSLSRGRAVAVLKLRITSSAATPGCRVGTRGTLTVTDPSFGAFGAAATAHLALPAACHLGVMRWQLPAGGIRAIA